MSWRWTLLGRQLEIWVEKDGFLVRQISLLPPLFLISMYKHYSVCTYDAHRSALFLKGLGYHTFTAKNFKLLSRNMKYPSRWRFQAPPLQPFQIPSYAPVPTLQQQLEKHFQRTALVHKEPTLPKAQSYHPPQFPNSFLENSSVLPSTAKAKNIVLFVEIIKYVCSTGSAVLKKNGSTTFIVSYGYAP